MKVISPWSLVFVKANYEGRLCPMICQLTEQLPVSSQKDYGLKTSD
jgi:hypothetical protein